jgi:molybdopterin-guanine dinucleotide biosynthesis protein A
MHFTGAVLTGGGSTRMGQDKSFIEIKGIALVEIVASALRSSGALEVIAVGGDRSRLEQFPAVTRVVADLHPNEGPLGGILTALHAATTDLVVVLACDTPEVDDRTPKELIDALVHCESAAVAYAVADGRAQPLTAAWRCTEALGPLERAFAQGERAPRNIFPVLETVEVSSLPSSAVTDVDSPSDLDRYAPDYRLPPD